MNKTCAVVVTYNRLELLKEVLAALLEVGAPLSCILVVDNASAEDTRFYLEEQIKTNEQIKSIRLETNQGGAGGFYHGMKWAFENCYNYYWLMDDDSIVSPSSLAPLLKAFQQVKCTGFACSKVVWTDGTPHKMNLPGIDRENDNGIAFCADPGYTNILSGSFVSMLISEEAVKKSGYPYKDFFIWADDLEYSRRLIKNGFKGLFVEDSTVLHKTVTNHNTNIKTCGKKDFWKMRYGFRNRTFMHKSFKEYDLMVMFFLRNCARAIARSDNRIKAFKLVLTSFLKGLSFQPKN